MKERRLHQELQSLAERDAADVAAEGLAGPAQPAATTPLTVAAPVLTVAPAGVSAGDGCDAAGGGESAIDVDS